MSFVNDASSFVATIVRLGRGLSSQVTGVERPQPQRLLELYEFENCPYCRKVREVLCELDLDYHSFPVAHGSPRRQRLLQLGGKTQVPYLSDPNTGTRLYESDDIDAYLNDTYAADQRAGWSLPLPALLDDIDSALASGMRLGRGTKWRADAKRHGLKPVMLYNMEGSPYCRKVRETLSELDLECVVRNLPKGSPKRAELVKRGGKMQVPYLVDPNTDTEMYESDEIVAYLETQYAAGDPATGRHAAARRKPRAAKAGDAA